MANNDNTQDNPTNTRLCFDNAVVLVTGGGKGVGLGISLRFLEAGATVYICGRSAPESLPSAPTQNGSNVAQFISADVRDLDQAQAMFDQIKTESKKHIDNINIIKFVVYESSEICSCLLHNF